ncbi:MAG: metallophosphoesterase [Candidatus Onthomonas sp.]
MSRCRKILLWLLLICLLLLGANALLNAGIWVTRYEITSTRLPEGFDGFRIVQVADLHSVRTSEQAELLLTRVQEEQPDLIVLTGDQIDSHYYADHSTPTEGEEEGFLPDEDTLELIRALTGEAPVYAVYGNHEMMLLDDPEHNPFKTALEEMGVTILYQQTVTLNRNGDSILLAGIQDPATLYKNRDYDGLTDTRSRMQAMLDNALRGIDPQQFVLLLSHRPEYFELYQDYPIDLALTGHAHGGQIRLPVVGGLYAPGQGWFPQYTSGIFQEGRLSMVVSRGLGNSVLPLRVFDPPELVTVTLRCAE